MAKRQKKSMSRPKKVRHEGESERFAAAAKIEGSGSVKEHILPLNLLLCRCCSLVQIAETVQPEILFCRDYPYFSSVSKSLLQHFSQSAKEIIQMKKLDASSLVVEAASNDGYMLKNFKGINVLGIDPSEEPAQSARDNGIPTLGAFFCKALAEQLYKDGKCADLFLANNVLAHVSDLNGFVEGIRILLKENGTAVIEVPYLLDLIDNCEFDTIYHQHLCYFSVTALDKLFRRHALFLNDLKRLSIHGGSLRQLEGRSAGAWQRRRLPTARQQATVQTTKRLSESSF